MPKTNNPTQEPFVGYKLDEEKKADTFTVKMNKQEREILNRMKLLIEQPKDSTALKELAFFGAKVLLGESKHHLIVMLFKNRAKNARLGIDLSV